MGGGLLLGYFHPSLCLLKKIHGLRKTDKEKLTEKNELVKTNKGRTIFKN